MSLPDLPDIFGNYALGDFNEVVSPPPIDWMPQTPGWYVVGAMILLWLSRWCWRRARHWYRNRYRKEALLRLRQLSGSEDLVAQVNRLLKLTALAAFPRQQVAQLWGEDWTGFLNGQCTQAPFNEEQCQLLALGAYRPGSLDHDAGERLLRASQAWVSQHRNRYDD